MDYYQESIKRLNFVEITCWSQLINGVWVHSHIDYGHAQAAAPMGDKQQSKAWHGCRWSKLLTYATQGKPIIVL